MNKLIELMFWIMMGVKSFFALFLLWYGGLLWWLIVKAVSVYVLYLHFKVIEALFDKAVKFLTNQIYNK